MNNEEKLSLIN